MIIALPDVAARDAFSHRSFNPKNRLEALTTY